MALSMNQIMAYRQSQQKSRETFIKKTNPQIEEEYMNLAKMAQSTFNQR